MSEYFYEFPEPLVEGIVKSRPNRFIAICDVNGVEVKAHCPVTGSIGGFNISGLPCLLSKASIDSKKRTTTHTLEALNPWFMDNIKDKWLGVNQSRVNRYVEELLRKELLNFIAPLQKISEDSKSEFTLSREPKVGDSKLDFLVNGELLVEVKTPLRNIYAELPKSLIVSDSATIGTERMLRQIGDMTQWIDGGKQGLLLTVFMYDARKFEVPKATNETYGKTSKAVMDAGELGLDFYQLNLELDKFGVKFTKYFKL